MVELLEVFVSVARTGSLRKSAEELAITQPTASWRLRQLEALLGQSLFLRSRRGMRLTEAGQAILPYAQRAIRAMRDVGQAMEAFQRGEKGRLVIGAIPSVCTYYLPKVLKEFLTRCPGFDVVVRTAHSEELLKAVLEGKIQAAFVREVYHPDITAEPILQDELVFTVRADHALAHRRHVRVEEIADEGLILYEKSPISQRIVQTVFGKYGLLPKVRMELDSADSAKRMALQGLGVAFLPAMAVEDELRRGVLVAIEIPELPVAFRQILLIRRRDEMLDAAAETLAAIVRQMGPGSVVRAAERSLGVGSERYPLEEAPIRRDVAS